MKVAGVLFIVSAIASWVAPFVRKEAFGTVQEQASSAGGALLVLLLGAGLYQGRRAVRGFVLVCAGLAGLAALGAIALFNGQRELQVLMAAALLVCAGYVVLLLDERGSVARAAAGVALVLVGATASLAAPHWLVGFERSAFGRELRPMLSDEREYADPESGLSVRPPPGWSLMRNDAGLFASIPAKVKLANPEAGTVIFLNDEPKGMGFVSLDHSLDRVLEGQRELGLEPRQLERRDVTVGRTPARRMALAWTYEKRPFSGFVSVWQDGPQLFTLFGAAVGGASAATDAQFRALEAALRFSAPVETALAGAERRLLQECPVFSADAVRMIGRRIPPSSSAAAYFRTGWVWAIRGQGQMDSARASRLRELMGAAFAKMSAADRTRFAAYGERVRGGAATTAAEDEAAMRILGRAATALPAETLADLRSTVDTAITVGGLL
jgi:hypothetical protein